MWKAIVLSLGVFAVAVFVPLAAAQGTYTQIDYPGSSYTEAFGINTGGTIVGFYRNSIGGKNHGFILSGGGYELLDYPRSGQTVLSGINNSAQIVGFTYEPQKGFRYDSATQTFTDIRLSEASEVFSQCINDAGTIAGYAFRGNNRLLGFERLASGQTVRIRPPNSTETFVTGIGASGELIGYYLKGRHGPFNFSFSDGQYQPLVIPNAPAPRVYGINSAGAIVGIYSPTPGVDSGFLYQNGILTTLEFPGASFTYAYGISNSGEVVGAFVDSSGGEHGFLWTPTADEANK